MKGYSDNALNVKRGRYKRMETVVTYDNSSKDKLKFYYWKYGLGILENASKQTLYNTRKNTVNI
jgi:hypothetical protein